jgi:TetR/AcrR family transcriptional regulator, transcriptional repressor for nem operon
MTKASRTRQYIIDKTAPLFNIRGYAGTSLLDLAETTGLSKGALYGNFSDKQEIALAVFHYSMERVRQAVKAKLEKTNSCREKLLCLFDFYSQYVFSSPIAGGCPLMNYAVQADDHDLFLKKSVAEEMGKTIDFISTLLEKGRKNGEFNSDIKPKELASLFFCSIEGAIVISRVSSSDAAMKAVIRHCRTILDQITI